MSYPICLLVITCIYALGCHAYTWIECTELGMNADILQYTSYPSLIVPMVLILLATANLVTTCIFRKRQKKNKGKTEDTQEVVSE